ncbi:MAG: hypothetical protein GHCLOJNM_03118 [bacterium]|nr:hypothetical protein [bacterium]
MSHQTTETRRARGGDAEERPLKQIAALEERDVLIHEERVERQRGGHLGTGLPPERREHLLDHRDNLMAGGGP